MRMPTIQSSYTKIFQEVSKLCAEFLGKLTDTFQRQIRRKETKQHLVRQLAFENTNEERQVILHLMRERESERENVTGETEHVEMLVRLNIRYMFMLPIFIQYGGKLRIIRVGQAISSGKQTSPNTAPLKDITQTLPKMWQGKP